ncbi:hypothetical protein JQ557_17515 [Bradyrhizobium sp. U87765 SZCCT0131]|uniref:hypothetical protein n=1 Tax=unclassified Bradyrhizobium TaxID=2631580 RepID=UPI001BAC733F|nr:MULTISPECIES: hypothetical protein [unclassified Bradyrhizobium]MBR1219811.1 hypothetical protein [Bradyrhizobium sp. U87765 SZCCT0131]MBR1262462.1 hypothetical protein [Bradyrhizobium sp. U87765 SZCCT0134]MBR1308355.1 hypothetical protein [Bradyrhizobium sp. U87765 SZCCT0110]MBR1318244.1 hypothetical protein [Bradyrhizobium sp. U87765 SZCCT0109]MBR1351947.1 hypothetical protein [Bradyrhizobium sp. U87765 SZCCT0048]
MRRFYLVVAAVVSTVAVTAAIAQTATAPAASTPAASVPAATSAATPAAPAAGGKRAACQSDIAGKQLKGQDRKDQMALCMAQGHVECLKQAIDQKIVGPQRRDFIKSCVAG